MTFMKSVLVETPAELIEDRRRRGLDRRDEVWEGVYHMVPPATGEHEERLVSGRLVPVSPNAEGWIYCEGLRAFFKTGEWSGKPVLLELLELDRTESAI